MRLDLLQNYAWNEPSPRPIACVEPNVEGPKFRSPCMLLVRPKSLSSWHFCAGIVYLPIKLLSERLAAKMRLFGRKSTYLRG